MTLDDLDSHYTCGNLIVMEHSPGSLAHGNCERSISSRNEGRSVIFNQGSAEPQGSPSICQGFCGLSVKK